MVRIILTSIFFLLFLHIQVLTAAQKSISSLTTITEGTDTATYKFENQATNPLLTRNDSVCMFPAYSIYAQWDTSIIHPYKFDASCFKDTVKLILTGTNSSSYAMPRIGHTNSNFGPRRRRAHFGVDIDLETGDSVVSAFDGMVRIAKKNKSYGNVVIVRHENGLETIYAHLSKLLVQPNQCVRAGELIGLGGNTGHSFGSHLHFEIRYKGEPLNPSELISFSTQRLVSDTMQITQQAFEFYMDCKNGKYLKKGKGKKSVNSKAKAKAGYYSVKKGDTLYSIARKYGTTTEKLCKLNKIKSTTVLHVGIKIRYS